MTDSGRDGFDSLPPPPGALEQGGVEVLRAVIVEGGLQVALRTAFEDASVWGVLLADVARQAARAFAADYAIDEDEALAAILDMFQAEFDNPTDLGTTQALS